MRIDAHTHGNLETLKLPPAEYVARLRARGIERIVLIEDPAPTFAAQAAMGDFIIPVPWVDIDTVTVKELHAIIDQGALGIKFIDPQFSYGDPRYDALYAALAERGKVAMFHTGYVWRGFRPEKTRVTDVTLMRPAALDSLARRHPTLNILMAHFGNPWWEEAWKMTASNPNIYAELSGGTAFRRSMRMWEDIFCPNGETDTNALSRILFASDMFALSDPDQEDFEAYFRFYDRLMAVCNVSAELREQINRGNAMKLFGLQ
jgi:predicted TIM-barrel fold metal-dependent hydrolase